MAKILDRLMDGEYRSIEDFEDVTYDSLKENVVLKENVEDYRGMLDNIKDLITTFDDVNKEMAFTMLEGLLPEIRKVFRGYTADTFVREYFGNLMKGMGYKPTMDDFKGEVLPSMFEVIDGQYVYFDQHGHKVPSYLVWDIKANKTYSIEKSDRYLGYNGFYAVAGFNLDSGILKKYKQIQGVDVYTLDDDYYIRSKDYLYVIFVNRGMRVYHKYGKEVSAWDAWWDDNDVPPIIGIVKAGLEGKLNEKVDDFFVVKEDGKGTYIFYSPKLIVKYESRERNSPLIFVKNTSSKKYVGEKMFKKHFPELAKYIQEKI
jgi:hypothetical protein